MGPAHGASTGLAWGRMGLAWDCMGLARGWYGATMGLVWGRMGPDVACMGPHGPGMGLIAHGAAWG
jgi:hypothetical protein